MTESVAGAVGLVHEDLRCELSIAGVDDAAVKVASFEGTESLSKPFHYAIVVATSNEDVASLEGALGETATFRVLRDGAIEHVVHGIVTEVLPDGANVGARHARTVIVIEPTLVNLRYAGGFRMFQAASIKDVITALLAPERIEAVWRVRPEPQAREYITQADESDLDFLARLAADEGIHYFFEHTPDKTTIVFTNDSRGFHELEGGSTLAFRDTEGAVHGEHVRSIRRAARIRTGAVEHRDYDFQNPRAVLKGRAETSNKSEANTTRREWRDYPGHFLDPEAQGSPRALNSLYAMRADAHTLTGAATSTRLSAGRQFTLSAHRDSAFNQTLVVTTVSLSAEIEGTFFERSGLTRGPRANAGLARFVAVPADLPLRPARLPKPASRLRTARVVGPNEGDPYVDEFGRIKVQFMWDRDGKFDEHSSCWIRMMTPVAHEDEGFFSAHKVGSEVLVEFLDGDIDRPIVIGAVYNKREHQPYKQPDKVTKSSWKVRSIPGGKGFNEITFENSAGHEQIYLHAQRDRTEQVLRNHSESVGANQSTSVGANQSVSVGANQSVSVGAKRTVTVKKSEEITVNQGRTATITDKDDTLTVTDGNWTVGVNTGNHTRTVKLTDKTTSKDFEADASNSVTISGDTKVLVHQKAAACTMEGEKVTIQAPNTIVINCASGAAFIKDNKMVLQGTSELVLQCGASKISLKQDGTIAIEGGKLVTAKVSDSTVKLEPAKAALAGPAVEVNGVGQTKIAGAIVKIN